MGIVILILCILIFIIIMWCISVSNAFNRDIVKIDEADSGIDVALTKRYDVLTKMIAVCKGYAKHEKDTIIDTIKYRKGMSMEERVKANNKMNDTLGKINVLAEAYPELKSSENFKTLQVAIADVEEHLQAARRLYNSNISSYNQRVVSFPSSIIASSKGLTKKEFFEADDAKKEDVKIEF